MERAGANDGATASTAGGAAGAVEDVRRKVSYSGAMTYHLLYHDVDVAFPATFQETQMHHFKSRFQQRK